MSRVTKKAPYGKRSIYRNLNSKSQNHDVREMKRRGRWGLPSLLG
jgi:hypothetical protein